MSGEGAGAAAPAASARREADGAGPRAASWSTPRGLAEAALRIGLGLLMAWAGWLKLQDVAAFAEEIGNFRLLPQLAPLGAITLPTVEIAAGLGLLLPRGGWRRGAAFLNLALLAVFTAALVSARARGIDLSCGCFGKGSGPVTDLTVVRDLGLLAWAGLVLRLSR